MGENESVRELLYLATYAKIYNESLNAYDIIIKNYPTLPEDIKTNKIIEKIKMENPTITDKELIAHAYTNIIMTYAMFGLNSA